MKSWPSRPATTGTNSWPRRRRRESMVAPSTATSGPLSRPLVARAIPEAVILIASTIAAVRLVILFGGRSAEHDVSCVTAASVLAAANRDRYDVVPVGIDHQNRWVMAEAAAGALTAVGPVGAP